MKVKRYAGSFAGDKDAAARIREDHLLPALTRGKRAVLDFEGVDLATQSFIHALIASVIREHPEWLGSIDFVNCNESVQSLIEIVAEYAQDQFD
ncbi:STAS-like domain-containing protein [Cellulomonas humilata]|uniref:STAS-like domain-containing protein n=1 Tax=Cellulomonas humilata TaxID=144055 RepID=A0A7Y6A4B4_9CELL|nr:STAS-like domain-containing protein [Cellulomonas humilata]NUU19526.1 STAS-like domain-containing protein [Cellulomonas humilata]